MPNALTASFTRSFPGGTVIRGELDIPLCGHGVAVLIGPSGCGKTTVLRCLAGIEKPELGHICFGGEVWLDTGAGVCMTPQQRGIGFVFQDYALFPHMSVEKNIAYGLGALPKADRGMRTAEMLGLCGLAGLEKRLPSQISGGQRQRVALARAMACKPRLLLLDEPLSALDTALRVELRGELRQFLKGLEVPALLVTHDMAEAREMGDSVIVMDGGAVLQSGTNQEVFEHPANVRVSKILGLA